MSEFDINTPVTNPALVAAMEEMQRGHATEAVMAFIEALKAARFLLPVDMEPRAGAPENGQVTLKQDTRLRFPSVTDAEGGILLCAYTDWPALKAWRDLPDEQTLVLPFEDLAALVLEEPKKAGFVLNPHSHNVPVPGIIIERALHGPLKEWSVKEEEKVRIGTPAMEPTVLKDAIAKYARGQKHIRALWLALMERSGELSFLVAVEYTGDRRATFDGIAEVAMPKLRKGELIDLVAADEGLGITVSRAYEPFYRRKRFGIF